MKLDDATVRRAIAASTGAVGLMARARGESLSSERPGKTARLGSDVDQAAIADCLEPNPHGSLLSAPLLVVEALRGKCK